MRHKSKIYFLLTLARLRPGGENEELSAGFQHEGNLLGGGCNDHGGHWNGTAHQHVLVSFFNKHSTELSKKRPAVSREPLSALSATYHIMPPMPGFAGAAGSGAGMSVMAHSLVRISAAMLAAF